MGNGSKEVVLPLVPLCRGGAALLVTPEYGYFRNLLPFGLRCWPLLSTFLPPPPFSDLSSHNPPILAVVFLVVCNLLFLLSDLFGDLSSFILTTCPANFIRFLTILPTTQALVPTSCLRSFILLSLLRLFFLSSCSHILVVYVDAVRNFGQS